MSLDHDTLYTVLCTVGLPVAYHEFEATEEVTLPVILFEDNYTTTFGADNIAYYRSYHFVIVLQEETRDLALENSIVDTLSAAGIYVSNPEVEYIQDEQYWETTYYTGG